MTCYVIILAAGQGTRMNSALPKVLHPVAGRPLIQYSLDLAAALTDEPPVVVVGHEALQVRQTVGDQAVFAHQHQPLGTAHAVQAAEDHLLGKPGLVVVLSADMPLFRAETLQRLVETQKANQGPFSMLTVIDDDPRGFGRVVRGPDGNVTAVVEEAQCTPEQKLIKELNVGAYCFDSEWLWNAISRVQVSPKGEYYLTDVVAIASGDGQAVKAIVLDDPAEAMGINTRVHLAEAEAILRRRINRAHMLAGVTMIDPDSVYIEAGVKIGRDTQILPNTHLRGKTEIGEGCRIGPNTIVENTRIDNACTVICSVLEGAIMEEHSEIGPFGHLRKGAHLGKGVHMGNFGEVKSSYLGPGTKMGHFSYIGDAVIGEDVNIGAGTITCNFDGEHKHRTEIGNHAFIGSDTMLVAPLKLGENARTGAGSVVTHDVPDGGLVVGVPARPFKRQGDNG
ncbi:MAG TPA: bifunctional UDP-N-acetylglucosamine diphosphorylase/glucosamine-1-phosphate N-acetyltransferase GlmU [Anaerolineaceae bacterium]|nr:bifunctional UDP-N-acetylglucosamine diphosphorylase/glucosamine-1-phosphate N-acetyltransferase GlmU [Anaerolineaceae bacterium]HPN51272.1 bifunctional UDP-N-acetylglucosamine diphosphorylase/glucosamine-1-phosphate N-acetyltransferase GlmU [Anaerolineaceae bacterium]